MPDINEILEEVASGPSEAQSDAGRMKTHSLKDLMEVAKYQAANEAVSKPHRGIRFNKLVPPGSSGDC